MTILDKNVQFVDPEGNRPDIIKIILRPQGSRYIGAIKMFRDDTKPVAEIAFATVEEMEQITAYMKRIEVLL